MFKAAVFIFSVVFSATASAQNPATIQTAQALAASAPIGSESYEHCPEAVRKLLGITAFTQNNMIAMPGPEYTEYVVSIIDGGVMSSKRVQCFADPSKSPVDVTPKSN